MFLLALSLFFQVTSAAQSAVVRTFDDDKIGAPPAGFAMAAGREAPADLWTVKREGSGRVLSHEGKAAPADSFAVAIFSGGQYSDVEVSVRLKATGGGRAAGLVWKYQDPNNHYSAQLDLVRQEVVMYRVAAGNRIRLEREDDLELDPDAWYSMKIRQEDGQIRVYLGGIRLFSERDRLPRTPSNVGIWVAGDSTVMFDDFRVEDRMGDAPAPRTPAKQ
ncbi:MAG: hypothetical protein EHM55_10660 [Acidobacteria bacterium]|nr:MAG: hypothetical protein EHM55_10660 [Acidobacteriota bacterium]